MQTLYWAVGVIFNVILCFGVKKIIGDFSLFRFLVVHLPEVFGGLLCTLLMLSALPLSAGMLLYFGRLIYTLIQVGKLQMIPVFVMIDIVCAFFLVSFGTNKLYK